VRRQWVVMEEREGGGGCRQKRTRLKKRRTGWGCVCESSRSVQVWLGGGHSTVTHWPAGQNCGGNGQGASATVHLPSGNFFQENSRTTRYVPCDCSTGSSLTGLYCDPNSWNCFSPKNTAEWRLASYEVRLSALIFGYSFEALP
jgi:hypothetical protein